MLITSSKGMPYIAVESKKLLFKKQHLKKLHLKKLNFKKKHFK